MNYFSFLGKGEKKDKHPSGALPEKQLFTETPAKNYCGKIKRLFAIDSTKESLSDNELLTYIQYDIKLHDLIYKTCNNLSLTLAIKMNSLLWNWSSNLWKNYH